MDTLSRAIETKSFPKIFKFASLIWFKINQLLIGAMKKTKKDKEFTQKIKLINSKIIRHSNFKIIRKIMFKKSITR
jgi:hypothetical protein